MMAKVNDKHKKDTPKIANVKDKKNKNWEPKKKVQFQGVETIKENVQEKKLDFNTIKIKEVSFIQMPSAIGNSTKPTIYDPIDMISMLSQITIEFPLSEMFRIEEHKNKALSWLGGIRNSNVITQEPTIIQQTPIIINEKRGQRSHVPDTPNVFGQFICNLFARHRSFLS